MENSCRHEFWDALFREVGPNNFLELLCNYIILHVPTETLLWDSRGKSTPPPVRQLWGRVMTEPVLAHVRSKGENSPHARVLEVERRVLECERREKPSSEGRRKPKGRSFRRREARRRFGRPAQFRGPPHSTIELHAPIFEHAGFSRAARVPRRFPLSSFSRYYETTRWQHSDDYRSNTTTIDMTGAAPAARQFLHFVLFDPRIFDTSEKKWNFSNFREELLILPPAVMRHLDSRCFVIFERLLERLTNLDLLSALTVCCPSAAIPTCGVDGKLPSLALALPRREVFRFLLHVGRKVVPWEIVGSKANHRRLLRNSISVLIFSGKAESSTLHAILDGIRLRPIMRKIFLEICHELKAPLEIVGRRFVGRVAFFIHRHLLAPIIRECFYVTEGEGTGRRVLFYRKDVWATLSRLAGSSKFSGSNGGRRLPVDAPYKWIPKVNGMRLLVNYGRRKSGEELQRLIKYNATFKRGAGLEALLYPNSRPSLNFLLNPAVPTLTHLSNVDADADVSSPAPRGISVMGHREVRFRLRKEWPQMKLEGNLAIVVGDLSGCFDRIPHKEVLSATRRLTFRPDGSEVAETRLVRVHHRTFNGNGKSRAGVRWSVLVGEEAAAFASSGHDPRIVAEVGKPIGLSGAQLHLLLKLHFDLLSRNQQLGGIGIPQGACTSPISCALYLGHKDSTSQELQNLLELKSDEAVGKGKQRDCILLRWVDDFIFLSKSQGDGRQFIDLLTIGEVWGRNVNLEKLRTNFPVNSSDDPLGEITAEYPKWADMRFKPKGNFLNVNVEVWKDVSLCSVAETFVIRKPRAGNRRFRAALDTHLRSFTEIKLRHGIFIDRLLNDIGTVLRNIRTLAATCALKALAGITRMQKLHNIFFNPEFLWTSLKRLLPIACSLVKKLQRDSVEAAVCSGFHGALIRYQQRTRIRANPLVPSAQRSIRCSSGVGLALSACEEIVAARFRGNSSLRRFLGKHPDHKIPKTRWPALRRPLPHKR